VGVEQPGVQPARCLSGEGAIRYESEMHLTSRSLFRALLVCALAATALRAAASERIAVLEFTGDDVQDKTRRVITDRARAAALEPARKIGYDVMTRESTALVMEQMGGQCAEGQCEIEMARSVGAALVMTGEVRQLEGEYFGDLKLHDTEKGSLLAVEGYRGKDAIDLLQQTPAAAERLLATGLPRFFGKAVPVMRKGQELREWYVEFEALLHLHEAATPIAFRSSDSTMAGDFGGRLGWRWNRSWAIEVGVGQSDFLVTHEAHESSTAWSTTTVGGMWLGVGAAWHPFANRFLSVAADGGVVTLDAKYDDGNVFTVHRSAPFGRIEARLAVPIGRFELGVRGAGLSFWIPDDVSVPGGMLHAGEAWLEKGVFTVWSAGPSLAFSF